MIADPRMMTLLITTGAVVAITATMFIAQRRSARLRQQGDEQGASRTFGRAVIFTVWGLTAIWLFVKIDPLNKGLSLSSWPKLVLPLALAAFLTAQFVWLGRKMSEVERRRTKPPEAG